MQRWVGKRGRNGRYWFIQLITTTNCSNACNYSMHSELGCRQRVIKDLSVHLFIRLPRHRGYIPRGYDWNNYPANGIQIATAINWVITIQSENLVGIGIWLMWLGVTKKSLLLWQRQLPNTSLSAVSWPLWTLEQCLNLVSKHSTICVDLRGPNRWGLIRRTDKTRSTSFGGWMVNKWATHAMAMCLNWPVVVVVIDGRRRRGLKLP